MYEVRPLFVIGATGSVMESIFLIVDPDGRPAGAYLLFSMAMKECERRNAATR